MNETGLQSVATGSTKAAIGADRFRALTERLKAKPAVVQAVPTHHASPVQVPQFAPTNISPVIVAPVEVPVVVAPLNVPVAAPVAIVEPVVEPVVLKPLDEPAVLKPVVVAPLTATAVDIAPAPLSTTVGISPFSPLPDVKLVPVEVKPSLADPLQRRLSGLLTPNATPVVAAPSFIEILPPPPPPPPPEVIVDAPQVALPTMQEVQARLHEDATARLEQIDLENIWRQALATPTLEERALFLAEAKVMMAEVGLELPNVAPEHDLSAIMPESEILVSDPSALPVGAGNLPMQKSVEQMSAEEAENAEVARSLLDMMASGANSGLPHERALASDTLLRLIPNLTLKPLIMLAERLAIMEAPPHLLVGKLMRDPRPEVSGPLLENCMQVSDVDLLNVVQEDNPGKRRMLARRRRLSGAVSSALIGTKDASVLLTLVRNANAEINHEGFLALIECAEDFPDILAPLSTRADLAAPLAFELFWKAPTQLRRFLLSRFLTDSETLTRILKITLASQNEDQPASSLSPGDMIENLGRACKGKPESSAENIAAALQVSPETIQRILQDRSGEAIIVMLKVSGFPRNSVSDVMMALKQGDIPLLDQDREVEELQIMYDTLSFNKARILLTYWDWAVRKSGPYAPVH